MTLNELNTIDPRDAFIALEKCCGSSNWVNKMIASRPFTSIESLHAKAEEIWYACRKEDWLEAFTHHPKIGDTASLEKKFSSTKEWAGNEQQGVSTASRETIQKLIELNKVYEDKFGFIFIVCATGKSADEMLSLLIARLDNEPETELQIAMGEQHKITIIRLNKLLA